MLLMHKSSRNDSKGSLDTASSPTQLSPASTTSSRKFSLPCHKPKRCSAQTDGSPSSCFFLSKQPKATVVEISASLLIFSFSFAAVYCAPAESAHATPLMEVNNVGMGEMDVQVPTKTFAYDRVTGSVAPVGGSMRFYGKDGGFDVNSYRYLMKVKKSPSSPFDSVSRSGGPRAFSTIFSPRLSPYFLSKPKRSPYAAYSSYLDTSGPSLPSLAYGNWQPASAPQPLMWSGVGNGEEPATAGRLEWNFNRL